ncbi:MAG: hypothetical protein KQJ78_20540 [Deltaproteobacteria bacterium]|nr:hypothetical protein [Deltaproteobacteria bacterium]
MLKDLINEFRPPKDLTATATFEGLFEVTFSFVPDSELDTMLEKVKKVKRGKEKFDDKAFHRMLAKRAVDWDRVSIRTLAELGAIQLAKVPPERHDEEVPFSTSDLADLMDVVPRVGTWLLNEANTPGNFDLAEEQGNSATG